jgi:hypothetical protein
MWKASYADDTSPDLTIAGSHAAANVASASVRRWDSSALNAVRGPSAGTGRVLLFAAGRAPPAGPPHPPPGWAWCRCTALPLLYAYYSVDASLLNNLAPGAHTLTVNVEHQQHSIAPAIAGAEASISYDDGANWEPATLTGSGGQYRTSLTVPASGTNGYVAIRFSAWDMAGNRIDQTLLRPYTAR